MSRTILFGFAFLVSIVGYGQQLSTQDSISIFYDSLFYHLENRFVDKDQIDWKQIKPFIKTEALKSNSLEASLTTTTLLFDTIRGNHINLFSENGWYKSTLGKQLHREDFHVKWLEKYASKPQFEVKLLAEDYGYVLMPAMLLIDLSQDSLDKITQKMYDAFMQVHQSKELKGWIIDLRFNEGGNIFPMLTSLYHLIGNNTVYVTLDQNMSIAEIHRLKDGVFYEGSAVKQTIQVHEPAETEIPVALITGKISGSCGELIPVAFRGRENVTVIGEETYGLLSGNDLIHLPFNAKIALTTGYLADRKAKYTPTIIPHTLIEKQANFEELSQDENIMEAMKFIDAVATH